MLDVCDLKMVEQRFILKVRVGSSPFFPFANMVIPTHSFKGVINGHR